jgi:hypothetical protein
MKTINSKVSSGLSRSLANLVDLFSKKTAYTLSRLAFVSTLAAAGSSPLMAKTPIGASHDVRFNSAPSRDSNLLSFTKLGIDPLHSDHIQFGGTETFELTKNTLEKHEEKYLGDLDWHRFIRQYVFNDLQKTKDYLINKEMLITGYVNKKPVEIKIHYDQEKDIFVSQEKYLPKNLDVVDGKIAVLTYNMFLTIYKKLKII